MKAKFYLPLLCLFIIALAQPAKACLDPDTTVIITINYDTLDTKPCPTARQMEMRLSNIRMMTEAPNKVCACAFASVSDLFSDLQYIAFVDSGTNNPYQGFAAFNANAKSSAAWQDRYNSSGSWKGFVAKVVNAGLKVGDPVELIVRAKAPNNTPVVFNDTLCGPSLEDKIVQSVLGTDEWDSSKEDLKDAHQMVRGLGKDVSFKEMNKQHFDDLDDEILTALSARGDAPVWLFNKHEVNVYPNPTEGNIYVNLSLEADEQVLLEWIDLAGRKQSLLSPGMLATGQHVLSINLEDMGVNGSGFLKVSIAGEVHIEKVLQR